MTDAAQELGKRVRAYREALGYTLSDLAKRSGVSRSYIYQVERGVSSPTHEKVVALARALDVGVPVLLGVDTAENEPAEVPEALGEYARQAQLPAADVTFLAGLRYRGRQPTTVEGWRALYAIIKATMDGEP
jgi:transcriptional regulator with XRE-family HTH domain